MKRDFAIMIFLAICMIGSFFMGYHSKKETIIFYEVDELLQESAYDTVRVQFTGVGMDSDRNLSIPFSILKKSIIWSDEDRWVIKTPCPYSIIFYVKENPLEFIDHK